MKAIQMFIPVLLLNAFLFISCNKDDDDVSKSTSTDFLIFGHFYGECMGEGCVEIFKLEDGTLYEDTNDKYPGDTFYDGNFATQLPQSDYDAVVDLLQAFPEALWTDAETVIGLPDAGDWGGLYVEYQQGSDHGYWLLDQAKSNVPEQYHDFIDQINNKIQIINP